MHIYEFGENVTFVKKSPKFPMKGKGFGPGIPLSLKNEWGHVPYLKRSVTIISSFIYLIGGKHRAHRGLFI